MAVVHFDGPCGHNACNLSRAHRHVYKDNGVVEYENMDTRELDLADSLKSAKRVASFWKFMAFILFITSLLLAGYITWQKLAQ